MKSTSGRDEDAPGPENVHELRFVALQRDLVMIGVCGLTLPPGRYPWDRFELEDETRRRKRWMADMRGEVRREKLRRRLRRI